MPAPRALPRERAGPNFARVGHFLFPGRPGRPALDTGMPRSLPPAAVLLAALLAACSPAPPPAAAPPPPASLVDDVEAARAYLEGERERVRDAGGAPSQRLRDMTRLGMWDEAESLLDRTRAADADFQTARAELRMEQHRYPEAKALVDAVLAAQPSHRRALLARARLQVQAWRLDDADSTAHSLLQRDARDEAATLLLGRIRMLRKEYAEALRLARQVQEWNPSNGDAYLLEADTRFWQEDPSGAEAPLVRALSLDPFDPDARFSYGYAIWRRVDATQLGAMAAQWNLALEVDPLHYVTHWHFGNGHTNLTYADYVTPSDSTVRERLAAADSLIAADRIPEAVEAAREVGREFPGSVLPPMLRASAFYMAWDQDRAMRLDSAEAIFRGVLREKPNYGPAHNGLAAVIKQRQVEVLADFDSLQAVIAAVPTPPDAALAFVFPDLAYYPGVRVERMVRQELGPSAAYLPLIERQGRRYRIPPLHVDLARAMGSSYFRTATTFDNRQWMDIRGVGSGAAAIEYVERGAFQERNVLLHEYVHLFHGIVFTDAESRRVRELYHAAMREGRALDYYAANNESEFLAQAYPAFLSPVKVHPLNHKSMNTRDDLRAKDPATFAFVDSLVEKQRAFLGGDPFAFRSNWAQVFVNLSEEARREAGVEPAERERVAVALLDTAMVWDAAYLPALLSRAALARDAGRFDEAGSWLDRAEALDPRYAPVYAARADLVGAREAPQALERRADLLRQALGLETDLAIRAELNEALRGLYLSYARLPEAIAVAEEYAADAPTVSTYLRDRRDEAAAFARELRASAGYAGETLDFFRALVGQKPQNYPLRAQFADALVAAGRLDEAAATLEEAQRILQAAGSASAAFAGRLAEIRLQQGDTAAARAALEPVLEGGERGDLRVVRTLIATGQSTEGNRRLGESPEPATAFDRAELAFTRAWISAWRGDPAEAERLYGEALLANPYHRAARVRLAGLLRAAGREEEALRLIAAGDALPLPLGPDFRRELEAGPGGA